MITGDYVKTAKAIAENIGLLPRGSPEAKAVDCAVVRVGCEACFPQCCGVFPEAATQKIGDEINELESKLEVLEEEKGNKITITKLKAQLERVWSNLDAITNYSDGRTLLETSATHIVVAVYARAKPEDKITIVRSLQRQGTNLVAKDIRSSQQNARPRVLHDR